MPRQQKARHPTIIGIAPPGPATIGLATRAHSLKLNEPYKQDNYVSH